jgi:DNA-directed RNA polymerase specialized sigma24 family protein
MSERPREDEQVAIRAELTAIHADLLRRAAKLVGGLRPPRPEPSDVVNTIVARILRKYRDRDIKTTTRQLAFTSLARVCIDVSRRRGEALQEELPDVVDEQKELPDPIARTRFDRMEPREQCVLARVNLEGLSVPKAFEACGWKVRSPYAEYDKLYERLRALLREDA